MVLMVMTPFFIVSDKKTASIYLLVYQFVALLGASPSYHVNRARPELTFHPIRLNRSVSIATTHTGHAWGRWWAVHLSDADTRRNCSDQSQVPSEDFTGRLDVASGKETQFSTSKTQSLSGLLCAHSL